MPTTITQLQATIGGDDTQLQKTMERIEASFAKMAAAGEKAVENIAKSAGVELPKVEKAAEKAGQEAGNALTKGFDKAFSSIGAGTLKAGKSLSLYLTLPLLALGKHAIDVAGDFEQSMQILQVATGATGDQMKVLNKLATDLGADLSIPGASATTAAAAMTELVKSGLSVNDTMIAAKPTLLLAAAGMMDNAEAAQIVGKTLNQFGLAGTEAARVANLLAGAGKNVSGGVKGMSDAITASGLAFRTLGIPIKDAITSLALLAKNGLLGERAGTIMKEVFIKLADPSKKAAETLKALHINLFEASGAMKPMAEVVQILHDKMGNLSARQKALATAAVGGARAFLGLATLAQYTGKQFTDLGENVSKSGQLQAEAASHTDGLKGAIRQLGAAFDTAINSGMQPFIKQLASIIQWIGKEVVAFSSWSTGAKVATVALITVAGATGPVLIALAKLKEAWLVLTGAEAAAAAEAVAAAATEEEALGGAAVAVEATGAAATLAAVPWVAAFAAMTGGVYYLLTSLEKTHPALKQFMLDSDEFGQRLLNTVTFGHLGQGRKPERFGPLPKGSLSQSGGGGDLGSSFKPKYSGPEEAAKALAASSNPDNLHPGKNNPALDTLENGKKKLTDYQKQLNEYTDHLAENVIKLTSARKGENSETQDARSQYSLLTTAQQNAVVASDAALKKQNDLIDEHKKYADTVKAVRGELAALGSTGGKAIAELAKEFPHATAAQLAYLNNLHRTLTEQEKFKDNIVSVARTEEAMRLQGEKTSSHGQNPKATGPDDQLLYYTRTQREAITLYNVHLDKLTEAQVKNAGAVLKVVDAGERGAVILAQQDKEQQDWNLALVRSTASHRQLELQQKATASGSAVAAYAFQRYGIVLNEANQKTKDMILSDYQLNTLLQAKAGIASSFQSVFEHAFTNINGGLKGLFVNILQGVDDMLTQIAAKFIAAQLTDLLFSLIPGGQGFLADIAAKSVPGGSKKALGGTVAPGQHYIVGENGPEMFVPSSGGRIVPTAQTQAMMGGGITMNVTINATDVNSFQQSRSTVQAQLMQIADAARRRNGV